MSYCRRKFLATFGVATCGVTALGSPWPQTSQNEAYADLAAADEWMKKWMRPLNAAVGPLHVGRFADPMYYLLREIEWKPEAGQKVRGVRVPVGFVTDFTSIPRAFWTLLRPDGAYTYPAIVHDYLYWDQQGSRADADLTLRYAMAEFAVSKPTIEAIYAGVRVGGELAWRTNASLKLSGEKRVLRQFPTDPTTSWGVWKTKAVF
jgi:hypothetical protein